MTSTESAVSAHSKKAITTLTVMNTAPADWKLADIKWVEELRMVRGMVECPSCEGCRWVRLNAEGKIIPLPPKPAKATHFSPEMIARRDYEHQAWVEEKARRGFAVESYRGNCPSCRSPQNSRMRGCSVGKVRGYVKRLVMVGYVQWPEGTVMDSRYCSGGHCHLCSKRIRSNEFVPVVGTGGDGRKHGMWVGTDCAKKFLNTKSPCTEANDKYIATEKQGEPQS